MPFTEQIFFDVCDIVGHHRCDQLTVLVAGEHGDGGVKVNRERYQGIDIPPRFLAQLRCVIYHVSYYLPSIL